MNYILIIAASILSYFLFEKMTFSNQIDLLKKSYANTYFLLKERKSTEEIIAESLIQLKSIAHIALKSILILLPFFLLGLYLLSEDIKLYAIFLDLKVNVLIILTFFCSTLIRNYARR